MDKRYFTEKVGEWYTLNRRALPWRGTEDPYRIWLSEVILQQTRVNQGLPYYERFLERFPDIGALAKAPERTVLRLWQGLGYYTRARNLHRCAREIVQNHGGRFPGSYQELKKLPGIGEYTAAAIASIAFQERVAVVDGNVFRVLARYFGEDAAMDQPAGKKKFSILASELIAGVSPATHNQAVMEFGALHCTPKNPGCEACILSPKCFASRNQLQGVLPVKAGRKKVKKRYFYYLVMVRGNFLWMKERKEKDIWRGLFDFFLIEREKKEGAKSFFNKYFAAVGEPERTFQYRHMLTHQEIFATFFVVKTGVLPPYFKKSLSRFHFSQVDDLPKPELINRFLSECNLF